MKRKVAVIVDDMALSRWQQMALREAQEVVDVALLLNCRNTAKQRSYFAHGLYYAINMASLRNEMTRTVSAEGLCPEVMAFDSIVSGRWQALPEAVFDELEARGIEVVIRFGMDLLDTSGRAASLDILSFHHGDPECYRGRPAGFYELLHRERKNGIIVQRLGDRVDGGDTYARAYSRVYADSYRQTAVAFYQASVPLLRKALENHARGEKQSAGALGRHYRLPGNLLALSFIGRLLGRKIKRLGYGAFFEKKWNVATLEGGSSLHALMARPVETLFDAVGVIPEHYTFYADPFFSADGRVVRVEALNGSTGLGEIVELDAEELTPRGEWTLRAGHFSYPFSFSFDGVEYLMPEAASQGTPYVIPLGDQTEHEKRPLAGLETQRLVDATLCLHQGRAYLFAGKPESARTLLYLYTSDSPFGPFTPHPHNPIVIDPECARMAGEIVCHEGELYRLGQDSTREYGNGITVSRITRLSPESYGEERVGRVALKHYKGPHTLNFHDGRVLLDFYSDEFSWLAGYRRLMAKVRKR